jgi:hypothetical protein
VVKVAPSPVGCVTDALLPARSKEKLWVSQAPEASLVRELICSPKELSSARRSASVPSSRVSDESV